MHPDSPAILAELFELVQGGILRFKSRSERFFNTVHGDHITGRFKSRRSTLDALMEDRQ